MNHNSNIKIEKATKECVSDIVRIHKDCVLKVNSKFYPNDVINEWLSQITEQNVLDQLNTTEWVVLKENENLIGFCQYDIADNVLNQIQIFPKYQGKGYGKYIYVFVENEFKHKNVSRISLFSTINALPFYETLGFTKTKFVNFPIGIANIKMFEMTKNITKNRFT